MKSCFIKKFRGHQSFYGVTDTLVLDWWYLPWVLKPASIPHLHTSLPAFIRQHRFISGVTPADLLMASIADDSYSAAKCALILNSDGFFFRFPYYKCFTNVICILVAQSLYLGRFVKKWITFEVGIMSAALSPIPRIQTSAIVVYKYCILKCTLCQKG